MHPRRRAFALIIVMIAIAAVFALTLRAAVISRSSIIESAATRDQLVLERVAGVAAIVALDSYIPAGDSQLADAGRDPAIDPSPGPQEEKKGVELPDFLLQMIPELSEVQKQARDDLPFDRGDTGAFPTDASATNPRINAIQRLQRVGLPKTSLRIALDGHHILVDYEDLTGLLDLNNASEDSIARLLTELAIDSDLASRIAAQILDWRDPDSIRRTGGAERDDYLPFGVIPRNAPIVVPEELLYLPDMTLDIFEIIAPYISFSSGSTEKISLATAPRPVLLAIPGMTADAADAILMEQEAGGVTEARLSSLLPPRAREGSTQFSYEISGQLRARIRIIDPESARVKSRFTAVISLSDRRSRLIGIRPQ